MSASKIASEAWQQFSGYFKASQFTDRDQRIFKSIFRSAIEEAYDQGYEDCRALWQAESRADNTKL